jgi:hypothetical protein
MSYIISRNNPFVSTKLTEKGREKLAKGQLTFKYWGLGDSEINYGYEEIKDANPDDPILSGKSIISTPNENQPNLKYFVTKQATGSPYIPLAESDVKTIKLLLNNKAKERGFFDVNMDTIIGSPYTVNSGTVVTNDFTGTNTIDITDNTLTVGNMILFKLSNATLGTQGATSNTEPTPHLWYKIESVAGSTYTLDRKLPNLTADATNITYIEYASGEIYENGMANDSTVPYWDADTLSFDNAINVPTNDVPFLNMNNIWSSNIIGLNTDTAEEFFKYGSNDMMGQRSPFLCYIDTISPNPMQLEDVCFCVDCEGNIQESSIDPDNKAISVIHYTNNTVSNLYGEFFYVDDSGKQLELEIPDLMYHRRSFENGSGSGDVMGMKFIAKGDAYYIKNSDIQYVDLIEDPTMVSGEAKVVGKVLINHQTIVIDDEEIVAALSYKSGRNWTLPELKCSLTTPAGGPTTGVLAADSTMYVTYVLESSTEDMAYTLPCQKYIRIKNVTSGSKDIHFSLNNIDQLPYMRKVELGGYDGRGFSADKFKILYQIVSGNAKPVSNAWVEYDMTSDAITTSPGETIDPTKLESQLPDSIGFKITTAVNDAATTYVINDKLSVANNSEPDKLQFGDERFFYGNLRTYIGASVFKTVFDIKISANEFRYTSNPTRSMDNTTNPPEIRVSEVGIYDAEQNLVFIGKLSEPMKLINGNTINVELSMDF